MNTVRKFFKKNHHDCLSHERVKWRLFMIKICVGKYTSILAIFKSKKLIIFKTFK